MKRVGGANDHPSTPTFVQIYKILTMFSILKPPKIGNRSISTIMESSPLMSVDRIKEIHGTAKDKVRSVK